MDENKMTEAQVEQYVKAITDELDKQRALNIEVLHVAKMTTMADYFILCTGNSSTHIRSLSEAVEHELEVNYGIRPHHIEGYDAANWILVDYGFAVVHIFHRDTRQFYALDRLWADLSGKDKDGE